MSVASSVASGLAASTSQSKSEITAATDDYAMTSTIPGPDDNVDLDIQVSYVDPSTGMYTYYLIRYKL